MSTHNMFFMENWRKLSHNYHQILLFNNSSDHINAHFKFGENPLRVTQVIVLKQIYGCVAGR